MMTLMNVQKTVNPSKWFYETSSINDESKSEVQLVKKSGRIAHFPDHCIVFLNEFKEAHSNTDFCG